VSDPHSGAQHGAQDLRGSKTHGSDASLDASRVAAEVGALVSLAALDAGELDRQRRGRPASATADERRVHVKRLSREVAESYERALRSGREPTVVRLNGGVCGGCHVRLHATLERRVRRVLGVAACPHCLRLVYDPAWLAP
jgi:predicted  nucleic acid-binding Zn-ribbon protein